MVLHRLAPSRRSVGTVEEHHQAATRTETRFDEVRLKKRKYGIQYSSYIFGCVLVYPDAKCQSKIQHHLHFIISAFQILVMTISRTTEDTTLNAIEHAISLNDEAVQQFMEHKDISRAVSTLSKVLQACRTSMGTSSSDGLEVMPSRGLSPSMTAAKLLQTCMKSSSSKSRRARSKPLLVDDQLQTANTEYVGSSTTTAQQGCCGYLYDKPITFPATFDTRCIKLVGIVKVCTVLSCAATFNIALVHQLAAREILDTAAHEGSMPRGHGTLLRKAARLYEICVKNAAAAIYDYEGNAGESACLLFDLAAINNLGIVYEQLDQHSKMKECFLCTLKALMYLTDQRRRVSQSHGSRHGAGILCSDDVDGFMENVVSCGLIPLSNKVALAA